jgi:hypothetical protein
MALCASIPLSFPGLQQQPRWMVWQHQPEKHFRRRHSGVFKKKENKLMKNGQNRAVRATVNNKEITSCL